MKRIAGESFEKIARDHSFEDIAGYKLLDKIPSIKMGSSDNKIISYTIFKKLTQEFKRLKEWRDSEESKIYQKWNRAVEILTAGNEDLFSEELLSSLSPWSKWRTNEMDKVKKVYESKVNMLNAVYWKLYQEKQAS